MSKRSKEVLETYRQSGRTFTAGGLTSFVNDKGDGEPVVLMHGVPASSFLYRKVVDELAERGMRGIAFDLPGLGFADRPTDFDYSWTGLGEFSKAAVDALELGRFHLVVHDIGGPVGLEIAAAMPERIISLTILNTLIRVDGFHKPWVMHPFEMRGVGELWLGSMNTFSIVPLMYFVGIADRKATPRVEIEAYATQLKLGDGGRAFLKIMRSFETTAEKQALYESSLKAAEYPIQIVWGARDTALSAKKFGAIAREVVPAAKYTELPAKHFLQEDQAPELARLIHEQAMSY